MKIFKIILNILFFISLMMLISCKKDHNYAISEGMLPYFSYQSGSYWIYKNDSTGILDSTSVRYYSYQYNTEYQTGITRDLISMIYNSTFLSMSFISYVDCGGPNYFTVTGIIDPQSGVLEAGGALAYSPNISPDTRVIPGCSHGAIYFYVTKSAETVNNIAYQNIIYSEYKSIDSTTANPYLYVRKIYFAKNVGIIKYYELYPHFNVNRSYSLLRYKVKQ